jgi:hypothetical protein
MSKKKRPRPDLMNMKDMSLTEAYHYLMILQNHDSVFQPEIRMAIQIALRKLGEIVVSFGDSKPYAKSKTIVSP